MPLGECDMFDSIIRILLECIKNNNLEFFDTENWSESVWYQLSCETDIPFDLIIKFKQRIPLPHTMIITGDDILSFVPPMSIKKLKIYNNNMNKVRLARRGKNTYIANLP